MNRSEPDVGHSLPEYSLTSAQVEGRAHHVEVDDSEVAVRVVTVSLTQNALIEKFVHCPHGAEQVHHSLQHAGDGDPHLTSELRAAERLSICHHATHVFAQVDSSRTIGHYHYTQTEEEVGLDYESTNKIHCHPMLRTCRN